jgi:hypothetical protein
MNYHEKEKNAKGKNREQGSLDAMKASFTIIINTTTSTLLLFYVTCNVIQTSRIKGNY